MKRINYLPKCLIIALLAMINYQPASAAVTTGVYTVGTGGTYSDLASAILDLNSSSISGPVIFNILPGNYSGPNWQMQLSGITGSSPTNTVTFQAQSGTVNITVTGTSSANYVFKLTDVSYTFIKNLHLTNNSTTNYGVVVQLNASSSHDSIVGCTLTGPTTTTVSNDAMAVVHLGYGGANVLSGSGNVVKSNTISGGSIGITAAGTSSSPATNTIIDNNSIGNNRIYAMYFTNNSNVQADNNVINASNSAYIAAINLLNNFDGLEVSDNAISVNVSSSTNIICGIASMGTNGATPTTGATTSIANNTITMAATTGSLQAMKIASSYNLLVKNNTAIATVSTGNVQLPTLAASCVRVLAESNNFTQTATGSGTVSASSFDMMSFADSSTVRGNVFISTTTSGKIFNGSFSLLYNAHNSSFNKNIFTTTSTTGTIYNYNSTSSAHYWMSNGFNVSMDSNTFNITSTSGAIGTNTTVNSNYGLLNNATGNISMSNNVFNISSAFSATSYGIWGYYCGYLLNNSNAVPTILDINGNTWNYSLSSSPTVYQFGYYMWYTPYTTPNLTTVHFNDNNINGTFTSSASFYLGYYGYYNTGGEISRNNINITENGSGTLAPFAMYPNYYGYHMKIEDNTVSVSGAKTGTTYAMPYMNAYASYCHMANNTFTYNSTSSGTAYAYSFAYGPSTNTGDTAENNTLNFKTTSGTLYNYNYYTRGLVRNNDITLNTTTGAIYNYLYYPNSAMFTNNAYKFTSTSGTIYGVDEYNSSTTYQGATLLGNTFDMRSTSGTIYGITVYSTYGGGNKFFSNLFTAKTSTGATYMLQGNSGYYNYSGPEFLVNNTFHSNSTGTTNMLIDYQLGSTSYHNKTYVFNNIFSRSNSSSGAAVRIKDTTYWMSDYNLIYSPGTFTINSTIPSVTASSLQAWRKGTGQDMNSLIYDPGYVDAAGFDFHPDPANPNSWAVQGRGNHFATDTLDILNSPRAKTRQDGVPDLGAYEFTPTSTPPDAIASPSAPAANSTQVFTFGGDTVCSVLWGTTVPSTVAVKQYTGLQAVPMPAGVGRMYFYDAINTSLGVFDYKPQINYKEPWVGDISSETNARIAKSSNGGTWAGYNYINSITDSINNTLTPANNFDSLSSMFTGVENARIGVRCVIAPTGLSNSLIGADSAVESWDAVFNPLGYQVIVDQIRATPAPPYSNIQYAGSNVYTIKGGLFEDTKYFVHLRTMCGMNDTSGWAIDSFTTLARCHAPVLNVNAITDTRGLVYWDTVRMGISYEYVIDQNPVDPPYGTMTPNRSVLATGLTPATTYYAHVRSYCNSIYNISVKADNITPDWSMLAFTTKFPTTVTNSAGPRAGMYVYPNPVKDMVTILLNDKADGKAELMITDVTGKILRNIEVSGQKIEVDMTSLPSGMYMVKYTDRSRTEITKITKE